jgi:hypothetical protein
MYSPEKNVIRLRSVDEIERIVSNGWFRCFNIILEYIDVLKEAYPHHYYHEILKQRFPQVHPLGSAGVSAFMCSEFETSVSDSSHIENLPGFNPSSRESLDDDLHEIFSPWHDVVQYEGARNVAYMYRGDISTGLLELERTAGTRFGNLSRAELVPGLFPESESLICVANFPSRPRVLRSSDCIPRDESYGRYKYIVPTAMRSLEVTSGSRPGRLLCDENVCDPSYLVERFDSPNRYYHEDVISYISRLNRHLPVVLVYTCQLMNHVAYTYAWFNARGASSEVKQRFRNLASELGSEPRLNHPGWMIHSPFYNGHELHFVDRALYDEECELPVIEVPEDPVLTQIDNLDERFRRIL